MRGTCFVASRLEVIKPGYCVFRGLFWVWLNLVFFFRFLCLLFLRAHTTCCKYETTLPLYVYTTTDCKTAPGRFLHTQDLCNRVSMG